MILIMSVYRIMSVYQAHGKRIKAKILDKHLGNTLRIVTTSIKPDIDELVSKKQAKIFIIFFN